MSGRRVAIVADPAMAAVHGLDGTFEWGSARTFAPEDPAALADWEPETVIALEAPPPAGPWRTIVWDTGSAKTVAAESIRRVATEATGVWRRAPLPAANRLAELRDRRGTGVLVVGGAPADRDAALEKLRARGVEVRAAPRLDRADLEAVAVVVMLGEPGKPLAPAAPAVLGSGRLLVAPRAEPAFGLLPWIDHVPYDHLDEMACSADAAQSYPDAFEAIAAMGVVGAEAHRASAVYGRLAIDAELEDGAA